MGPPAFDTKILLWPIGAVRERSSTLRGEKSGIFSERHELRTSSVRLFMGKRRTRGEPSGNSCGVSGSVTLKRTGRDAAEDEKPNGPDSRQRHVGPDVAKKRPAASKLQRTKRVQKTVLTLKTRKPVPARHVAPKPKRGNSDLSNSSIIQPQRPRKDMHGLSPLPSPEDLPRT